MSENQKLAQKAAELLWACATSYDHAIAWSRSPVYQAAETCFLWTVREAYQLSAEQAEAVRSLLAEYGPDDSLQRTTGRGVASYIQAMRQAELEAAVERMSYPR
jgi:hypothetical protein